MVLLHGITRTSRMMQRLEVALTQSSYTVLNIDYPSVLYSIEILAEQLARKLKPQLESDQPLHFVGHSMGGILVRLIIRDHRPRQLGRVVLIGVPNHGSRLADFMQRFAFYRKQFGPAGMQIGTKEDAFHHQLPPADYECGVIAGNRSYEIWFSWFLFLGCANDGKVSVENTKLEGMTDFAILSLGHTALPKNKKVICLVQHFLSTGRF